MRNALKHWRGSKGAQPSCVLIEPGGHSLLLRARLSALHIS
jgi:hypothetical protein